MYIYDSFQGNWEIAKAYHDSGLNVLPLRIDGEKRPTIYWKQYVTQTFSWWQASGHFTSLGNPKGIGIVCGSTSNGLEVIDHDARDTFIPWAKLVEKQCPGLIKRLTIIVSPRGYHVWYLTDEICPREILARDIPKDGQKVGNIRIETRAQGNIVVAPGSHPNVHKTGIPYRLAQGDICNLTRITSQERAVALAAARSLNLDIQSTDLPAQATNNKRQINNSQSKKTTRVFVPTNLNANECTRPGDRFNQSATWEEILEPHGLNLQRKQIVKSSTETYEVGYWQKPNSTSNGWHATTNYKNKDRLHVFGSIDGFAADQEFHKFAAYTILNFNGDFKQATRYLSNFSQ